MPAVERAQTLVLDCLRMTPAEPKRKASRPTMDRDSPHSKAQEHDLDLIRASLKLQPEERLAVLQDFVDTFWTPRHG